MSYVRGIVLRGAGLRVDAETPSPRAEEVDLLVDDSSNEQVEGWDRTVQEVRETQTTTSEHLSPNVWVEEKRPVRESQLREPEIKSIDRGSLAGNAFEDLSDNRRSASEALQGSATAHNVSSLEGVETSRRKREPSLKRQLTPNRPSGPNQPRLRLDTFSYSPKPPTRHEVVPRLPTEFPSTTDFSTNGREEPSVHVRIGTIEVRAILPPEAKRAPKPERKPLLSLQEYLRRRNEGLL